MHDEDDEDIDPELLKPISSKSLQMDVEGMVAPKPSIPTIPQILKDYPALQEKVTHKLDMDEFGDETKLAESDEISTADIAKESQFIPWRQCISLRDFGAMVRVSYPTMLRWNRLKMINTVRLGGRYKVTPAEVERFKKEGPLPPQPEDDNVPKG